MRHPTETYIRNTGYSARAFLRGLTAALMNGYAAQELHANVTITTTIFSMTLSFSMHIRAPTSRGNRQYPRRLRLWKKMMCPPCSRTLQSSPHITLHVRYPPILYALALWYINSRERWAKEGRTSSRTLSVRTIAPAANTAKATANTWDYKSKSQLIEISTRIRNTSSYCMEEANNAKNTRLLQTIKKEIIVFIVCRYIHIKSEGKNQQWQPMIWQQNAHHS